VLALYLRSLSIRNFRKLKNVEISFDPGLNIVVGPNNVGKTAVIDALRSLLNSPEDPSPKFFEDDIYRPKGGTAAGAIEFHYVFDGLDPDDEADFLSALIPNTEGKLEAHIHARYSDPDKSTGRLRLKRWCGLHEENTLNSEMMEDLRGVYLPPLRDAALGLRPSRTSQLARLVHILADEAGRLGIDDALKELDLELKKHPPLVDIQAAIKGRHNEMVGAQLAQALEVDLSGSDFKRFSSRLSLMVDAFEIEQNGLGFNNLIFMAVVLSELAKNQESAYRGLIVEEPEAHLHPQLQAVLLRYLESIKAVRKGLPISDESKTPEENGISDPAHLENADSADTAANPALEPPVQVFVTSHSPNFASIAKLSSLVCLVETDEGAASFLPRSVVFGKGKREKLERYLDATRAEIFFASRIIFVEGAAELMLLSVLAHKCGHNLRDHGVSLISVEGLNFDCFMPLFGKNKIRIPVSVVTDADPTAEENGKTRSLYPKTGDKVQVSDNTASMLKLSDEFVRVFHGLKTLEYDLALHDSNRAVMIKTLKSLHPKIGADVETLMNASPDDAAKAKALFCGMFERENGNVSKGRFGQALAQELLESHVGCDVPSYIKEAIEHVCGGGAITL
jgi:putative ATP-dependent endonuclease of OLD family